MKKESLRVFIAVVTLAFFLISTAAAAGLPVYSQTHVAVDFAAANDRYAQRFFDGCGTPMDGTDGAPDLCLPGLTEPDNMVPQGIAYYPAKDQMLISAYSKGEAGSVIFALDMADGHLAAEYHVIRSSGSEAAAHFGGIACTA